VVVGATVVAVVVVVCAGRVVVVVVVVAAGREGAFGVGQSSFFADGKTAINRTGAARNADSR
jgi:hypothetical protein